LLLLENPEWQRKMEKHVGTATFGDAIDFLVSSSASFIARSLFSTSCGNFFTYDIVSQCLFAAEGLFDVCEGLFVGSFFARRAAY